MQSSSSLHFAISDVILKRQCSRELWVCKAVACGKSALELTENACRHMETAYFRAQVQVLDLILEQLDLMFKFWHGYLIKGCIHIRAQRGKLDCGQLLTESSPSKEALYCLLNNIESILKGKRCFNVRYSSYHKSSILFIAPPLFTPHPLISPPIESQFL